MSLSIHILKDSTKSSIVDSIERITTEYKLDCFQFFPMGPRSYTMNKFDISELLKKTKHLRMYVHSTHFTSWKKKYEKHITDQLVLCDKLKARGWVIHLPKALPCDLDFSKMKGYNTKILLEVRSIRTCPESYETLEKLKALITKLKSEGFTHKTAGIVIDTAHIYMSDVSITTYNEAKDYIKTNLAPIKKWIDILHLNGNEYDTKVRAGDKHITPLYKDDKIWGGLSYEESGVRAFVEWYLSENKDIIFEPKKDLTNWLKLLKYIQNNS